MKTEEELTQELALMKAKYGTVYSLTVPIDDNTPSTKATIYLRKSDRLTTSIVRKLTGSDVCRAIEAGITNLYIGGDDLKLITGNDDALLGCESALVEIMNKQEATLKKN